MDTTVLAKAFQEELTHAVFSNGQLVSSILQPGLDSPPPFIHHFFLLYSISWSSSSRHTLQSVHC